jgi:hypothetical protein
MSQTVVEEEENVEVGPAMCFTDTDAWCMTSIGIHVENVNNYSEHHSLRIGQRVLIINAP